jgi:hypothetical protein
MFVHAGVFKEEHTMTVTIDDFKAALALFEAEFIGTMKTGFQKFLSGAALAASGERIDAMLAQYSCDGKINVEALKAIVDAGMRQCGGQFEIPINFGILGALGAMPLNVTVSRMDTEKFFTQTIPSVCKDLSGVN